MFTIAKHQIQEGLRDAKFIFLTIIVWCAFTLNGVVYSQWYQDALNDWNDSVRTTTNLMSEKAQSLQDISQLGQTLVKPPSCLSFLSDSGEKSLPNAMTVNAFIHRNPVNLNRGNRMMPIVGAIDWSFISGSIMTLLAVLMSFGAICGEKRDGTLRLLLSFPISRISVLLGKALGLVIILIITFTIGVILDLVILSFNNVLPWSAGVVTSIAWAYLLSVFTFSAVLMIGMAVSSATGQPAVSLVVLLVIWTIFVVAMPGVARLYVELTHPVKTNYEIPMEVKAAREGVWSSASVDAHTYNGNPYAPNVPLRAQLFIELLAVQHRIEDAANEERLRQAQLVMDLGSISPSGLLNLALSEMSYSGVTGFRLFSENAKRYQKQLHDFTVEKDRLDPKSPHLVYSSGTSTNAGVFSQLPVELGSVPRSQHLWDVGGLPLQTSLPLKQLLFLMIWNVAAVIACFVTFLKYDPR